MIIVNPNHRLRTELAAVEPPLWAGLCASYHDAKILDAEAEDLTLEETETAIRLSGEKDVLIVVMGNNPSTSSTPKMPVAEALADRIKDLKVAFTGIHPIAVDYQKYPVLSHPFEGFPNMPFDRLPMDKYRAHNWQCLDGSPRNPYASVYTSLGCSYNCNFCNIHTLYGGRQVRFRPVEDVLREIDLLATRYKVRNIKIWDELFTLNEDRVSSICDGLKNYDLNIWVYGRVDTANENMLKKMKQAGVNWVAYGFESASETIRHGVSKKFSQEKMIKAIEMTRAAGINIIANVMFGLPDDSRETMQETLDMAKEFNFEWVNASVTMPYPGSQLYEDAIREGANLPKEWADWGQYSTRLMPLPTKYLSGEEIIEFRDNAFHEYFSRPEYLEMIEKKFGLRARDHIEAMLRARLVRN